MRRSADQVSLDVERVVNDGVGGEEHLCRSLRFKLLLFAFSSLHKRMRILRSIVCGLHDISENS